MDRATVTAAHRRNVGWTEGPNNQNPWGPRQGIANSAYCDSGQSVVAYDCGYRWWHESQCGELGCAYCPSHINVGQAHGEVMFDHASRGQPCDVQEGDLLFYDWNGNGVADHVEYAEDSVGVAPKTHNIGYNTGSPNGCRDLWRDRSYLLCRLRPTHYWDGSQPGQPGSGGTTQVPPPPTPSGPRVLSEGMTGDDVREWQHQLNTVGQYGLTEDGDFGRLTANATRDFQSKHGCMVDGQVGSQSRRAMAAALAAPPGPAPAPQPAPQPQRSPDGNPFTMLAVDGDFGAQTVKALQWRLTLTEGVSGHPPLATDGQFGPMTKRYMQQRLNWSNGPVGIDGSVGPQTIRALQAHTGAGIDGQWGSDTTRHLQNSLNNAAF